MIKLYYKKKKYKPSQFKIFDLDIYTIDRSSNCRKHQLFVDKSHFEQILIESILIFYNVSFMAQIIYRYLKNVIKPHP